MRNSKSSLLACTVYTLLVVSASGCDLIGSGNDEGPLDASGVIVVNGGNFGDQNGSLSSYSPSTGEVIQGASLNGFLQGLVVGEGHVYVMVNTFSVGHIQLLDAENLQPTDRLENLPAPRSMVIVGDTAYVTNLIFGSGGQVIPISLKTKETGRPLATGTVPEGIAEMGGRVFVADQGSLGSGSQLYTFEAGTSNVQTVDVPCDGPKDLFPSKTGELIILCSGMTVYNDDYSAILSQTNGAILFFDPETFVTSGRIDVGSQLGSTNGTIAGYLNDTEGTFHAIAGEVNLVYRIDTSTHDLQFTLSLPAENGLMGLSGIAYDPVAEKLYVGRFSRSSAGDFPDFTSSGTVVVVNGSNEVESSFIVGPAPSQIVLIPAR